MLVCSGGVKNRYHRQVDVAIKKRLFGSTGSNMVPSAPESQWILELFLRRVNWNFYRFCRPVKNKKLNPSILAKHFDLFYLEYKRATVANAPKLQYNAFPF
jgi:hypothetical protein